MADSPFFGLADDQPHADLPQRERELRAAQGDAQKVSPDAAALAAKRAEQQGVPFATAIRQDTPEAKKGFDWGALESESPVLARSLREDPAFAAVAQDDVENLSWWDRWMGGWRDIGWATKEGWKRGGGDTLRLKKLDQPKPSLLSGGTSGEGRQTHEVVHDPGRGAVQLGVIGWMDLNGQATPELLQKAADIEREQDAQRVIRTGYLPGIFPAAAESLPLMIRGLLDSTTEASAGLGVGAAGGSVIPGVGTAAGGLAGLGAGFKFGLAASAGRAEAGLAWLEYKKIPGVDLKTAKVAAQLVGIANGALEMVGFETVLKRFPVLEHVLTGGKATRDIFRKVLGDNTKRAAFARLVGRLGEAGVVEGSTEFLQELNTIVGGVASGDKTMTVQAALERAWGAGVAGAQGGIGMALPGVSRNLVQDVQEAQRALQRQDYFQAMGEKAAESKVRARLPVALEQHLDRLQRESGGPVETISAPAAELKKLFQQEGITDEQVQQTMPDVARQLATAEMNPTLEVTVPTSQFATYIAPLKGFAAIQQDLRVGDGLTIREAQAVQEQAKKVLEEQRKVGKEGGEEQALSPEGKVFNDVLVKLKNAGMDEETARTDAAVWAAVSSSRASRGLAKDAFEYYSKQTLEVGHEDLGGAAVENFRTALDKLRADPPERVAQDPALLSRMAARRSLGERFSGYRVLSPAEAKIVDQGGALAPGRAFLAGPDALAEAARTGGRAVGVSLTPEDLTHVTQSGEVHVRQLEPGRVTAQPVTLGQMSQEARALGDRVAAALGAVDGPAPGAEVALPPHPTTLFQIERDTEGKPVRDADGNFFPTWKAKTEKWMAKNGYTAEQIRGHLAAVNGQMSIFAALGGAQIDLLPRGARERGLSDVPRKKGPIRSNVDPIYKVTFDATAMCVKRLEAAATQSYIETKLHRSLTASERLALIAMFKQAGKTAPCIYCYVEAPRGKGGDFVAKAISIATGEQDIPGHWKAAAIAMAKNARAEFKRLGLTPKDIDATVITDAARASSKAGQKEHLGKRALYDFLEQQYNYAKVNKPKLYEEYNGQILEVKEDLIQELNRYAGFRFFSTSDFQAEHVIDLVQAFRDLSLRQAKAHAYTKVRDFAEIFGATGMKIQTSIFAKQMADGSFVEDSWQGMKWKDAQELRAKFENVGTVLVATSDEMVTWGLNQPWVDYIIPFHCSSLEKKYYETLGWSDFTATQSEKSLVKGKKAAKIRMYELGAEGGLSNAEMSKRYLALAEKRKLRPVFEKWKDHPEFAKLKKDYARTDSPFVAVDASKINMEHVGKVLETVWQGTAPKEQVDKVIADQLMHLIKQKPADVGVTALAALERGQDIGTAVRESKLKVLKQEDRPAASPQSVTAEVKASDAGNDLSFHHEGTPFRLDATRDGPVLAVNGLGFERGSKLLPEPEVPDHVKNTKAWGGSGYSTATYLAALRYAVDEQLDFVSDGIRSKATERMYERLAQLGLPVERSDDYERGVGGHLLIDHTKVTPEMLDAAWVKLQEGRSSSVLFQPAYHGTAVRGIAKFSTDFMGTGEGAQAYGWGLYFAERKGIAEDYRKKLARSKTSDLIAPEAGQTYEVDLPEKDQLLNYDAPLAEQPDTVMEKLAKSPEVAAALPPYMHVWKGAEDTGIDASRLRKSGMTGEQLYDKLSGHLGSPEAASRALRQAGIDGLIYWDGVSRKKGEGTHNFVIWNDDAIKIMKELYQRSAAKKPATRGYVTFDQTRSWFKVTFTGQANLSTFLHESGHAFLEMLTRDAESGHAGSQQDLVTIRQWLGAEGGGPLSDAQLEQFARGFEAYLMEGKAPSEELRGVFATVKAWMKSIYRTLTALQAPLTDEVRGVFDRLLASDEAIAEARQKALLVPMFEGEGKVREMFDKAVVEATDRLEQEAIQTMRRAVRQDLERVQADVDEEVAASKAYNAWEVLSGRDRLDRAPVPEELKGQKLDREAVRALELGGKVNRKLLSITTAEGGLDLDVAASFLGYANGLELVKGLGELQGRAAYVKQEVTRRLTELYPGYDASPAWLEQEAMKELHSGGGVALALLAELEAITKHINGKAPPRSVLEATKLAARERTGQLNYLELNAEKYRRAESLAAREAQEAYGAKKVEEAYDAKRRQIWNHFMYREVLAAREEMDRIRDYLSKFDDLAVRKKIGLAGQNYLEAIDAYTEALDLKRRSMRGLKRAQSLAAYLAEMEAKGEPVAIPPDLRDETQLAQKNYRLRTLEDMRAVEAAVANLEHLATLKNKLRIGKELRDFKDTTEQLSAHIEAKAGARYAEKSGSKQNPGWWDKKKEWLRRGAAYLQKMEFVARALDGDEIAGFAHSLLFQPLVDAEKAEVALNKQVVQKMNEVFDGMTLKERLRYDRTVEFLGTPMHLRDVLAVALNMGNDGNKERLLRGYAYRGWTEEAVLQRLDDLLDNKDLARVESIWKTIDSLWPAIADLQQRTVGLPPERVQPVPVELPSGRRLSGGYYPVVKDRRRSHMAEKIAERKEGAWENNFMAPVVEHGFTKRRGADMSPLLLDLSVVPAHLHEVVHYVTHYEAVRAVDRLTQNKEVRAAITNALGREAYLEVRPWLEGIAADGKVAQLSPLDGALRHLRFGSSIVLYGFKVTTGLMQVLGLNSTIKDIGLGYTARGVVRFARELARGAPFPQDSFEVSEIALHTDRDVAQLLDNGLSAFSAFGTLKADIAEFSMRWMMLVQKSVNAMAYYGAYEKAVAEQHPDPSAYADSVVRMSQSAAGVKDLAAVQRAPEAVRMFAVAYSYFSVLFNQLAKPLPPGRKLPELAARWWWLVFMPVMMEGMLRGKKPEGSDKPEDWLKFALAEQFLYVSRTVPLWSSVSESFINEKEARTAPWIAALLKGAAAAGRATHGGKELSATEKRALADFAGAGLHLPSGAAINAARYLEEFSSGSMQEPIQNLLFRSPGQFK